VENRHAFLEAGGEDFHYIPALNDRPDHIQALTGLIQRHLAGWPEADPAWDGRRIEAAGRARAGRARALGAD
jgi:ferrochelatase